MNSFKTILKNIKNLIPYFIVILIYFFFISLEANKKEGSNRVIEEEYALPQKQNDDDLKQIKIKIPVVPYKVFN